ncbi:class I SAM-dependent methyltransferase [Gammaproteobacteria bacterium]|nr:class I SAM-dependent methyltransferase [Gammaproteobacteria bacterium]
MKWHIFNKKKKSDTESPKNLSETSKAREVLAKYCTGDGLDIGFGGDPITPAAICIDLPERYARYKELPQHLHGDARQLHWFRNDCMDYVYSSHVLEDFEQTEPVLKEWLRVLKPGGRLVLFLPDEQVYREYCQTQGKPPNQHHIHENFGLKFIKDIIELKSLNVEIEHEAFPVGIYSFELVLKKTGQRGSVWVKSELMQV